MLAIFWVDRLGWIGVPLPHWQESKPRSVFLIAFGMSNAHGAQRLAADRGGGGVSGWRRRAQAAGACGAMRWLVVNGGKSA